MPEELDIANCDIKIAVGIRSPAAFASRSFDGTPRPEDFIEDRVFDIDATFDRFDPMAQFRGFTHCPA